MNVLEISSKTIAFFTLAISLKCLLYYFVNKLDLAKCRRINSSSEQPLMLET